METIFYPDNSFDLHSQQIADLFGGLTAGSHYFLADGSMIDRPPTRKGFDDEYDAYRHLLLSAKLTESYGADNARAILDSHEGYNINLPNQQNMDRWNNDIGIKSYQEWKHAIDMGQTTVTLEKWLYDQVKAGNTINNPHNQNDNRVYDGPKIQPTTRWDDNSLQFKILLQKLFGITLDFIISPADGGGINVSTNTLFNTAAAFIQPVRRDPLTLDLDGDGLETVGTAAGVLFDATGNGIKVNTGWVKVDDGLLVLDKNGNGGIDSGRELFGDATLKRNGQLATDGFDALRDLDSNNNGKLDAGDAQFNNLRVWRDLNQNGTTQTGELYSLGQLGIASINVGSSQNSQRLANGNQIADLGTYTKTDGSTGTTGEVTGNLADINFVQNTFRREFADHPDTRAVANLPDLQGSGAVREAANDNLWGMAICG